ncbi:uncharacterized protein LOC112600137 [Melanaphis sacchari]|uniref:uncharacterized protein LOC112600137 n=1 Tax=Melanaphis sacchari TaxID=742174 RepID=UPI000DC143E7|nr:uncharacterized protein LOC112600137 [Melanaphis sacchari]
MDSMTRHEAECLCKYIEQFKFLCSIIIWYDLLNQINPQRLDSDNSFDKYVIEASRLVSEIDVVSVFEQSAGRIKARRVKRQFDYENMDEPIIDPKINFKICNYFLTDGDSADINGLEMADELRVIIPMVESNLSPIELLKFVINIGSFAPNLSIALRILLALPVTVASGERSFSKLKLIKTYLRSTMANDRLSGLAMIAIEHQLCRELDIEEIIKDFSNAKARKVFH